MNDAVLRAYHRLPAPLRSVAATVRGRYLVQWRYGPETNRLVDEALERDAWSASRWRAWQSERLAYILHRAATHVPFYRAYWTDRRRHGDASSWERLENWPVLAKESVRLDPLAFIADDRSPRTLFHEYTSGTTGTSVHLYWSREAVRAWYAIFEARCRHWYDTSRHDRWAMLAGQLVTSVAQRTPPFWVWNRAMNQLYMSSYHLAAASLPAYVEALARYRITHLSGYPSSLYHLALGVLATGRRDLRMRVVITNAEKLLPAQRAAIAEAFRCPICETYGMAEIVTCASECRAGGLHLWPEIGIPEVIPETRADDGTCELLGTSLLNADMPLVRYRTGDRGTLPAPTTGCACGRGLPLIGGLEGRAEDTFYTIDGRRVGRLDPVFKKDLPVREAQLVQERLDRVRVRIVPADGFGAATERDITHQLRERLGDVDVVYERLAEIPRTSRGKFRFAVCALPPEERERLRRRAASSPQGPLESRVN